MISTRDIVLNTLGIILIGGGMASMAAPKKHTILDDAKDLYTLEHNAIYKACRDEKKSVKACKKAADKVTGKWAAIPTQLLYIEFAKCGRKHSPGKGLRACVSYAMKNPPKLKKAKKYVPFW